MTEIIIRGHEIDRRVEVHIEGELKDIVTTLAAAIMNDQQFGALIITALAFIAEEKTKFPDINPN